MARREPFVTPGSRSTHRGYGYIKVVRAGRSASIFTLDTLVNMPASMSADDRLAVYGSLAPGKSNHHMLARYAGRWLRGRVRGDLVNAGWGAVGGFPGLIPRENGPWVDVQVFESPDLRKAWPELDEFEGHEYDRTVVPVYSEELDGHVLFEANVYALARTRRA